MKTEKSSIEILRGVAAFGIVGCHLALGDVTAAGRWVTRFCDFNVAVFAFVAGYLMWSGLFKYSAAEYVKRRAWRLLPAYAVWSVVYLAVSFGFKVLEGSSLEQYGSVGFWLSVVFKGGASCHLWFVACLFYIQALMRLMAGGKRDLRWGAVFGMAAVLASAWLNANADGELKWFGTYPLRLAGFLLLGCSFAAVRSGMRDWGWRTWLGVSVVAGCFHVLGGELAHAFVRDMVLVVPWVGLWISLPVRELGPRARAVCGASMGVFLVHPIVTKAGGIVVKRLAGEPVGAWWVIGDWVACWLVATIGAMVMSRAMRKVKSRLRRDEEFASRR